MPRGYNQIDEAIIQGRLWQPNVLRPSFWIDASDSGTLVVSGTNVTQWNDKSGNGRNFVLASGASNPQYTVSGQNGLSVVTFGAASPTNTIMVNSTDISSQITNLTHGVYWVFRQLSTPNSDGGGYNPSIGVNGSGGADRGALHYLRTTGRAASYPYFGAPTNQSYDNVTPSPAYGTTNYQIMAFQANATTSPTGWSVFRNGTVERTTTPAPGTPTSANQGYLLGGQINPLRRTHCAIGEVIMVQNVNLAVRQIIEGYLAWKWGLVSNLLPTHPYINRPPLIGDN